MKNRRQVRPKRIQKPKTKTQHKGKLSEYDKRGLVNHGSDACLRYLLRRSAAIVNKIRVVGTDPRTGQTADSEEIGSGCPMKWDKHYFVLSAAHVFENAKPKDLHLLTFGTLPSTYRAREALTMSDIVDAAPLADGSVIHRCQWEDLAVVTVDREQFPDVDFTEPLKDWTDPAQGENVNSCGFPVDHSIIVNRRRVSDKRVEADVAVWPTAFGACLLPFPTSDQLKFYYDDLRSDRHYLVPYNGGSVSNHPSGFSGAAVWWESDERQLVWRPNFRFAGTITHCHKRGSIVRVVKASVVRRFLAELFGDANAP